MNELGKRANKTNDRREKRNVRRHALTYGTELNSARCDPQTGLSNIPRK